jgi:hypothetical protein
MSDKAREVLAAKQQREEWAAYGREDPRDLENTVHHRRHGTRAAMAEARDILGATDQVRESASHHRDAVARRRAELQEAQRRLANTPPTPEALSRAQALPAQIEALQADEDTLSRTLAAPWPPSEAVLRGAVAVARMAVALDRNLTANRLDAMLHEARSKVGAVLAMIRDAEFERRLTEAALGQRLTDSTWSQDDLAILEKAFALAAIRLERRPAPAKVAA